MLSLWATEARLGSCKSKGFSGAIEGQTAPAYGHLSNPINPERQPLKPYKIGVPPRDSGAERLSKWMG